LFVVHSCFSQNVITKNYSQTDGLPSNAIYSIFKDSRNFLWVGTDKGLSKIENNKITNFYNTDGLGYNNCWSIVEDSNNNLWFGSYGGGVTYYNGTTFEVINETNGLVNDYVRKLFTFKNTLYVGTKKGVSVINTDTNKIIPLDAPTEIEAQIMDFFEYNNIVYFQSYTNGIWRHDSLSNKLVPITKNNIPVFSLLKNKDSLLVSFDGFIHKNKSLKKYAIPDYFSESEPSTEYGNSVFWDFIVHKTNTVYAVADGINYPTGGVFEIKNNIIKQKNEEFNINSTKNWSIDYDAEDNQLYVGTLDEGLFKVDLSNKVLFHDTIKGILDLQTLDKTYFFLTKNGVRIKEERTYINIDKSLFYEVFRATNKSIGFVNNPETRFNDSSIDDLEFKSLKIFNNVVWVNTTIGLYKIDFAKKLAYYPIYADEYALFNDNSGYVQRPFSNLIFYPNINNLKTTDDAPNRHRINLKGINAMVEIDGELFMSTNNKGLYSLKNKVLTSYLAKEIWDEKELQIYTTTAADELVIGNPKGEIFTVDVKKGFRIVNKIIPTILHGKSIKFIKSYKDYLIIGTEKAINFYRDNKLKIINKEHGVNSPLITSAAINNDVLTLGSKIGFYELDLNKILNPVDFPYHFKITNLLVNFKDFYSNNFKWFTYQDKGLVLPYQRNNVAITFKVDNHPYSNNLEYRHKIDGLENTDWSQWSTNTQLNFLNLTNGKYPIRLEVRDNNSAKNYTDLLLTITIEPPFWKRIWFFLLMGLTLAILSYLKYKLSIKKIKTQEALKSKLTKRIAETKLEALQSQMNPHFTFNVMSSIQNYIIDKDIDEALMYVGEFSKLIRKTLDNSSETRITLEEEIDYLKTYIGLENMRFGNAVQVSITYKGIAPLNEYIPPMLLQPLVENSFNHAYHREDSTHALTITFSKENNFLKCEIKDNGSGFRKATQIPQHTSKAIRIIKERLSLISDSPIHELINVKTSDKGTITTICVPAYNAK